MWCRSRLELPLPASATGRVLERRQEGQPPDPVVPSWKAQHGLHQMFKRLALRKNSQIGAVTMAREPVGFAWAPPEQA